MTQATAAVCEIKLENGDNCGIAANGRCATCGRAFCPTHQAWSEQTYFRDQCAPCFAESPAVVERVKKHKRAAEFLTALGYFSLGSARTALLTSSVQPIDISWVKKQWKRSFFSMRYGRDVKEVIHGRGWILGEFRWDYAVIVGDDHWWPIRNCVGEELKVKRESGNWLTVLLDLPGNSSWTGLARVHHVSGGYEALGVPSEPGSSSYDILASNEEFVKVAQAVKRLTGASS